MRNAIFSYCNFQINPEIAYYKKLVMDKLLPDTGYEYRFLEYKAKDGDLFPDDAINYGVATLFNEGFDNILILDIDCIPLTIEALDYAFTQASKGILIGNVQRSHYLSNGEHLFIGSSCLCLNRDVFDRLGRPNFVPTTRGDIAEELVYIAEDIGLPIEFFEPEGYETSPYGCKEWELDETMNPYGIGTTFRRRSDKVPMFYHLFESRTNLHVDKFINKCRYVLDN